MATTRGQRLRAARARRGFKSGRLAARSLGIPPATYGAHERAQSDGGRDFGPDEAKFYGKRFGVSPEWLLTGSVQGPDDVFEGLPPARDSAEDLPKVPVVGYVGTGDQVHLYVVEKRFLDRVLQPLRTPKTTVAVEIRTNVFAFYFKRWFLFYDSVRRPPNAKTVGFLCAVGLEDGRTLIKQLHPGSRDGVFNLLAENLPPIHDAKVVWASRIDHLLAPEPPPEDPEP